MNSLKNLEMMRCCWNKLSKRTVDWAAIRLTIEDQLRVQKNWNLHPRNPNLDMTGLKEAYRRERRIIWAIQDRSRWKSTRSQLLS